jgi:hypothetical protein
MDCGAGGNAPESSEAIGEELIHRRHLIDLQELEFSRLAAEFAKTNEYLRTGFATSIDWIRLNCHMTGPAAADRVSVGGM